jgi:uncharacterized membrane protein YhaH (DUF805 family)
MDWSGLFFSAEGRIGQKDYWLAALILLVLGVAVHAVPGVGALVWFLSFYCWICIFSKRLHDIGRSGWLQILPFVAGWILMTSGAVLGVTSLLGLILTGFPHFIAGMALGGVTLGIGLFCLGGLVHFALMVGLGLATGQVGSNRYGPEPRSGVLAAGL